MITVEELQRRLNALLSSRALVRSFFDMIQHEVVIKGECACEGSPAIVLWREVQVPNYEQASKWTPNNFGQVFQERGPWSRISSVQTRVEDVHSLMTDGVDRRDELEGRCGVCGRGLARERVDFVGDWSSIPRSYR